MSEEHAKMFISVSMAKAMNKSYDLGELDKATVLRRVLTSTAENRFGIKLDEYLQVFMVCSFRSPGVFVMFMAIFYEWLRRNPDHERRITLDDFSLRIFPFGYPNDKSLNLIWSMQKAKIRAKGESDNLLDRSEFYA